MEKTINFRIVLFPSETEMLPLYERLLTLSEREASNIIKLLLVVSLESNKIPNWFNAIDRIPFPSYRGRSIRISLDASDHPYTFWVRRLLPLNESERIIAIKQVLRSMLLAAGDQNLEISQQVRIVEPISVIAPNLKVSEVHTTTPEQIPSATETEVALVKQNKVKSMAALYK